MKLAMPTFKTHGHFSTRYLFVLLCALFIAGCGNESGSVAPEVPVFDDPRLQEGRNTWVQICQNCHLMGVVGAPQIGDAENWEARIAKGRNELYANAINGIGHDGSWTMPPRGGEARLTDKQVRLAVDFMLEASLKAE